MTEAPGTAADLAVMFGQVQALDDVVAEGYAVDEGAVYDFNIRWGAAMSGRLPRLQYCFDGGRLPAESAARYVDLVRELRRATPLLEGLRSAHPKVPIHLVPGYVDRVGVDRK